MENGTDVVWNSFHISVLHPYQSSMETIFDFLWYNSSCFLINSSLKINGICSWSSLSKFPCVSLFKLSKHVFAASWVNAFRFPCEILIGILWRILLERHRKSSNEGQWTMLLLSFLREFCQASFENHWKYTFGPLWVDALAFIFWALSKASENELGISLQHDLQLIVPPPHMFITFR